MRVQLPQDNPIELKSLFLLYRLSLHLKSKKNDLPLPIIDIRILEDIHRRQRPRMSMKLAPTVTCGTLLLVTFGGKYS